MVNAKIGVKPVPPPCPKTVHCGRWLSVDGSGWAADRKPWKSTFYIHSPYQMLTDGWVDGWREIDRSRKNRCIRVYFNVSKYCKIPTAEGSECI